MSRGGSINCRADAARAAIARRAEAARAGSALLAAVQRRVPTLKPNGREFKACCPFHDESTPSFHVIPEKGFFHCFGCGASGDSMKFVMDHDGVDFIEALRRVESDAGLSSGDYGDAPTRASAQRPASEPARKDDYVNSRMAAVTVWNAAGSARETIVETYLKARGINPALSGVLDVVRYLPRCPVSLWKRRENWLDRRAVCPAMLLPIVRITGGRDNREQEQIGVEVVFLEADGSAKKRFAKRFDGSQPPSRKMWGALQGGGVPIPPLAWRDWTDPLWIDQPTARNVMTDEREAGEMVVAEGFESTLSLYARRCAAIGAFATLSLDNMQGRAAMVPARDSGAKWREALPLYSLSPDYQRAVFTVPDVPRVIIGVDADMKGLRGRWVVQHANMSAEKRDLSSLERSQICATLAKGHWRRAGSKTIAIERAPMGSDFNDLDKASSSEAVGQTIDAEAA
ncbi:MAG: CHC2 zinc finger domain-containing protein [Pseudomonadota bacterium]